MSSFEWPPTSGGGGVPIYSTISAFPNGTQTGQLAVAADTEILYVWTGSAWEVLATPSGGEFAITSLTGDVTATGPGAAVATIAATTNATLATLSALTTAASLSTVGTITSGTWDGTTIAVAHGGTGVTSVTTTPTATAFAGWDTNKNLTSNNAVQSSTVITTAGATTTLTIASTAIQICVGSTTQTVQLPAYSTLPIGFTFTIINESSGTVTVKDSASSTVQALGQGTTVVVTAWAATGTTPTSWSWVYGAEAPGTVDSVALTMPAAFTVANSPITSSGTLAVTYSGTAIPVSAGGTGITSGTSGGVPYYAGTGTIASSSVLTAGQVVVGGGTGSAPTSTATPQLGVAGSVSGTLGLAVSTASSGVVTLANGGTTSANAYTFSFPTTGGTSGYALTTNGSGTTTWTSVPTLAGTNTWSGVNTFSSATASTSTSTGAVVLSGSGGGLGMAGNIWVGGTGNYTGAVTMGNSSNCSGSASGAYVDFTVNNTYSAGASYAQIQLTGYTSAGASENAGIDYAPGLQLAIGTSDTASPIYFQNNNYTTQMGIAANGVVTITNLAGTGSRAVVASASGALSAPVSDSRLKKNVVGLETVLDPLTTVNKLNPVAFHWDTDNKRVSDFGYGQELGFIAQEVESLIPQVCFTERDGYKGMSYEKLVPLLVSAIQQLTKRVKELEIE